jgi:phosphoribosylanthranilate isomerase
MKFTQNNPLVDYRENLILAAALQFSNLQSMGSSSPALAALIAPLCEGEELVRLINDFAYNSIERIVPDIIVESVQHHMTEAPIDLMELREVLTRPINDALGLKIFKSK